MDYNVKPEEWQGAMTAKDALNPSPSNINNGPAIDKAVSKIVGKPISVSDPRLIKLVIKWKQEKTNHDGLDNFLEDPDKIKELKEIL